MSTNYLYSAEESYQNIREELGPDICKILDSDGWSDFVINSDGRAFLDDGIFHEIHPIYSEKGLYAAAYMLASSLGREYNKTTGQFLDGVLPTTAIRVHFESPPVVPQISVDFRRLNTKSWKPEDLVNMGVLTHDQSEMLIKAIRGEDDDTFRPKNIVFAGATGSGKTTMMNAYLTVIQPEHRIITIEDTEELQISQPNKHQMYVNTYVNYGMAIPAVLRLTPKRIIIGEMRYGEQCLETLKLWNTGHSGGLTTIHANSCDDVIYRMRDLCQEVSQMPADALETMIKHIIDVIVFVQRTDGNKRVVKEIKFLKG